MIASGYGVNKKDSKQDAMDNMIRILINENNIFKRFSINLMKKTNKKNK